MVASTDFASVFGRYEFLIRRLHSLTGLIPVGGFMVFHLATNAAILDGPEAFQHRIDLIHSLGPTTIMLLEWPFIFVPLIFHALIGLIIVSRGERNMASYPFEGNVRYTLQRVTGVIAFLFIFAHVFHMHGWIKFEWWLDWVRPFGGGQFAHVHPSDPALDPNYGATTAAAAIQASWVIFILYAVGILASVYHLANGLWTMGITWGVWTSPQAQKWANIPCAAFGVFLAVVGLGALVGMQIAPLPESVELPAELVLEDAG